MLVGVNGLRWRLTKLGSGFEGVYEKDSRLRVTDYGVEKTHYAESITSNLQ